MDANTYFQIASNTKAFTTALLAQLVDSGRLAWDDPVTKYLPWFVAHSLTDGQLQIVPLDTIDNTLAAGGIIANVNHLAKWMVVRLDSGAIPGGGRLFSTPQAAEMWSPQTILPIGNPPLPLGELRANFAAYAWAGRCATTGDTRSCRTTVAWPA